MNKVSINSVLHAETENSDDDENLSNDCIVSLSDNDDDITSLTMFNNEEMAHGGNSKEEIEKTSVSYWDCLQPLQLKVLMTTLRTTCYDHVGTEVETEQLDSSSVLAHLDILCVEEVEGHKAHHPLLSLSWEDREDRESFGTLYRQDQFSYENDCVQLLVTI